MDAYTHTPVMLAEVLDFLRPAEGGPYWDLTLGGGGHLMAFLEAAPAGTVAMGLDGDPDAMPRVAARLESSGRASQVTLVHGDLACVGELADAGAWAAPKAVLFDFGLSSPQVDDPTRGFSYRTDGPLDMRMDPTRGEPASEWLNHITRNDLERVIGDLGEERYAGRIARVIKESLPIQTTLGLAGAVERAVGGRRDGKHHPARRTFQAIRIAVNDELGRIERALDQVIDRLQPGGRVVCLTFHSGEDRVVKDVFRSRGRGDAAVLSAFAKKPIDCSDEEARTNPRARSARLRFAERG